ncbi:hypothetical protein ALC56_00859 [Trachymyrmex septentrionalis]|uniref:Uncharacterized protein n=1 Tax=Trachymyrmex septentrionalis TaxID=34720 RepID=A0A195FWP8_9HYME|nr:hypothetical protein ALC56_00859 [Trachymyrmex septentrionalis]
MSINRLTALSRGISFRFCFFPGSLIAPTDLYLSGRRERRNLTRGRDPAKGIDFDLVASVRNSKPLGGATPAKRNIDESGVIGCRLSLLASIAQSVALIKTDNTAACTTRRSSISAEYKEWRARIGLVSKGRPTSSILSRYEPTGFDTIENGTLGDFSSRKLPPVLCGISSRVFTPDWEKTGRTLPSRPMELLNSSIHRSRGKKNESGIVHWKRERTRDGGVEFWKSDLLGLSRRPTANRQISR